MTGKIWKESLEIQAAAREKKPTETKRKKARGERREEKDGRKR